MYCNRDPAQGSYPSLLWPHLPCLRVRSGYPCSPEKLGGLFLPTHAFKPSLDRWWVRCASKCCAGHSRSSIDYFPSSRSVIEVVTDVTPLMWHSIVTRRAAAPTSMSRSRAGGWRSTPRMDLLQSLSGSGDHESLCTTGEALVKAAMACLMTR